MNERDRSLLWYVGAFLLIIGLLLLVTGAWGASMAIPCPAYPYQCPSNLTYWVVLYAGATLVIIGVGMMIASRRM